MVVCSITAAVEQLLLFVIRSELLRFVNRAMTDSSTSSAQCVICDELVQGSETIRVEDEAMTILVRAKKRQNVKWQPANDDFLIVHALCAEIYTRCSFASNVASGIPVRTLSKLLTNRSQNFIRLKMNLHYLTVSTQNSHNSNRIEFR